MKLSTRLILAMIATVLATAATQSLLIYHDLESAIIPGEQERIRANVEQLSGELEAFVGGASEDVLAIAGSRVVLESASVLSTGEDKADAGAADDALQRLESLLRSTLVAKRRYSQLRFIGVEDQGREVIRVDRNGPNERVRVVPRSELQQKGARDYFAQTIGLPVGAVRLGRIDLYREHGELQTPHHPTLRASTPVYNSRGKPAAILIANADMGPALESLRRASSADRPVFVVSPGGDYLVHPDRSREFGQDLGHPVRLQSDFPDLAELIGEGKSGDDSFSTWTHGHDGRRYYAEVRSVQAAHGRPAYVIETVPYDVIMRPAAAVRRAGLLAAVIAAACAGALAVVITRAVTKPLEQMAKAVESFSDDSPISPPRGAAGEVAVLADAVSRMSEKVVNATTALKEEVAERRRAQAGLRDLAAIVSSSGDAILSVGADGAVTSWNHAAERLYGFSAAEVLGRPLAALFPFDRQDECVKILRSIQTGEGLEHFESQQLCKDGATVCVSVSVSPVKEANDQPAGVSIIARDMTRQRQADTEQDRFDRRFRATVEAAPTAIIMVNERGEIELVNAATEALFGYRREELLSRQVEVLVPERYRRDHGTLRAGYFSQPETRQMGAGRDLFGLRKDGTEIPIEIGLSPIEMEEGVFVLSTIADITPRKQAEAELRNLMESLEIRVAERTVELRLTLEELTEAKEASEAGSRAKSVFLANMSHEIRSPIHAVIGATDFLLDSDLNAKQQEFAEIIQGSSESLLSLVNDILDFSKIEAGQLDLERVEFDHTSLLESSTKSCSVRAQLKEVGVSCRVAPDVPARLIGDPNRLRQLITNLLDNAVKFTEAGSIKLAVRCLRAEGSDVELEYAVTDTGIGIPADKLRTIFYAFEQADTSVSRRFGGSGLGLAISSRLASLMGGRLVVDSTPGEGSTFRFTARFGAVPTGEAPPPAAIDRVGASRALVVATYDAEQGRLAELLEACGLRTQAVVDPQLAIDKVAAAEDDGEPIDLVVLDFTLPGVDGFELTAQLRQAAAYRDLKIVILYSAEASPDIARCLDLKVAGCVSKPIDEEDFLDTLRLVLKLETISATQLSNRPSRPLEGGRPRGPLRVLVAEDSKANQLLAHELLTKNGHQVQLADNGREALDLWLREPFDLVLMDIQMPELDGLEVIRRIRKEEAASGRRTPIVALTAHAMKGDREMCLTAGADAYLAKPFRGPNLLRALDEACGIPTSRADAGEGDPSDQPADDSQRPPQPMVNWNAALEVAHGDKQVLRRLADICVRETDDLLGQLSDAAKNGEANLVQRCAHTLKGHYRIFDVAVADHLAFHIENTARDGNLDVDSQLCALRHETDRLQAELIDFIDGRLQLPEGGGSSEG